MGFLSTLGPFCIYRSLFYTCGEMAQRSKRGSNWSFLSGLRDQDLHEKSGFWPALIHDYRCPNARMSLQLPW